MTRNVAGNQKIQLKKIAAEAATIVISILLAFGIDAWWDDRNEEDAAREYAGHLLAEANENLRGLRELIVDHDKMVNQSVELIRLIASGNVHESDDRVRVLVLDLMYFSGYQPATSALDNIMGGGGLARLDDPQLQLAVSQYAQAIEDHKTLQAELADLVLNDFTVFFADRIPFLAVGFSGSALPVSAPESAFRFDPDVLVGSLQFENMIVRRLVAENDAARYARRLAKVTEDLIAQLQRIN